MDRSSAGEPRPQRSLPPQEQIMMAFLGTVFVGLIVGLIARAIKPGDDKMGWVMTILLGILGSVAAGFVGRGLGWYQPGQPAGWIASVIGAIVLLVLYGMVRRKG
ncbi:transglycosylase [Cupriavidus sp. UYMMa02A]|nr:transglycosylase [Cupriavidus sp. UYMMa02A]